MTFHPTGSLGKRRTGVFPVIPDKESQLSWKRDLGCVTSCDVPEHLPDKDPLGPSADETSGSSNKTIPPQQPRRRSDVFLGFINWG